VAARYEENGKLSDVVPSLQEAGHRLAAIAGTSTCHIVQVYIFLFSSETIFNIHIAESRGYLRRRRMGPLQGTHPTYRRSCH
jgi:hypothetical protein